MRQQWLIALAIVTFTAAGLWLADARQGTVSFGDFDRQCVPTSPPGEPDTVIVTCDRE